MNTNSRAKVIFHEEGPMSMYRDSSESNRHAVDPNDLIQQAPNPKILLVDDDPMFCKVLKQAALKKKMSLNYCNNVDEFGALGNWDYDVIIMDFDLGAVTGFELTSYLENYTDSEVPVILVSQTKQKPSQDWPETIREFVHKGLGPFAVLEAACEANDVRQIHNDIMQKRRFN